MIHDPIHNHLRRGPASALASAWNALCCLPATHLWFWLARALPLEPTAPGALVLLDYLSGVLVLFGPEAFHG